MDGVGGPDGAADPDRYDPERDPARTLPELLGSGAQEDTRSGLEWLVGLLAVLLFLALTPYLFGEVLEP